MKINLDLSTFKRDIDRESKKKAQEQIESLTKSELTTIGDAAIEEMKKAIAKGLSPIKENGRFPAYKWANRKSISRKKGIRGKELKREFEGKYPFNMKKKFPSKRERPVNLKLSGDFLNNLKSRVQSKKLLVGFFEEPWTLYESGHREGVNGQPKRPIIPTAGEEFSDSIMRRLVKAVKAVFDKKK